MSTNAMQPNASFTEQQYWSLVNYNDKYNSYLSVFRDPNITDDAMMNQTLSCSAATAQNVIVNSQSDNNLGYLVYLILVIPVVLIGGGMIAAFIRKPCCTVRNAVADEIQLEQPTVPQDETTSVATLESGAISVSIGISVPDTISGVALSSMSSSAQSLDQSLNYAGST